MPAHRYRHGQWVLFRHKEDVTGDYARYLGSQGAALGRNGKLLGIYQRASRCSTLVVNGERKNPEWLPERIMLVEKHLGENLLLMQDDKVIENVFVHVEFAVDVEPVLDRADIPYGRLVPEGYRFLP